MKTRTKILIAFAVIILIAGVFIAQSLFQTPQTVFRKLIKTPIPNSVQALEERHFLTMDSAFWVLRFQINKADLQTILADQHFTPIDENEEFKQWDQNSKSEIKIQKEDYLAYWKQRIQRAVKLDVNFTKTWQIFTLKEGHGQKYFFFDTNSAEAVFVAEAN